MQKKPQIVVRKDASDRELLQYTVEGSREAFDLLIERFRHRLVSFAWRLVGDRDLAEDVAQEAFLRAYRSCARYNGQAEVSTWLFTIARNLCLNVRRDRARHAQGASRPFRQHRSAGCRSFHFRLERVRRRQRDDSARGDRNQRLSLADGRSHAP